MSRDRHSARFLPYFYKSSKPYRVGIRPAEEMEGEMLLVRELAANAKREHSYGALQD